MKAKMIVACALAATLAAGCSSKSDPAPTTTPDYAVGAAVPGDFTGSGPGTLVSALDLPLIDRRIAALSSVKAKVVYQSTNGVDGAQTTVSGVVFAPKGTPPQGGWPIIALAHGTTGVLPDCAPSLDPTLKNSSTVVAGLLKLGYVVTASDYQGLGTTTTYHPYLDATTVGYNVIDSVRAARKLVTGTSDRWLPFGGSQGGQAAWASNELSPTYGQGLNILGSVSLSPAADMTFLAGAAAAGTLTEDQKPLYQAVLFSLSKEYPDLNLDDYRRGIVKDKFDVIASCDANTAVEREAVIKQITNDDLKPSSPEAEQKMLGYLQKMALPKATTAAPMLIIYGGKDTLVNPDSTTAATTAACARGDSLQAILQPDAGHDTVDGTAVSPWIQDRFANVAIPNFCGASTAETTTAETTTTEPAPSQDPSSTETTTADTTAAADTPTPAVTQ